MKKKKKFKFQIILGILGILVSLSLLFSGRYLIAIFGGLTAIQLLVQGFKGKKTNANN